MTTTKRLAPLFLAVAALAGAAAAATPRLAEIKDADTRAWWELSATLSSDAFEGRDTGSAAYAQAARIVAERFRAAGLTPAGDGGSFFQTVPLHEVKVEKEGTSFTFAPESGNQVAFRFLHDISVRPADGLPGVVEGALGFRGYCSKAEMGPEMAGKIAVCFGGRRNGVPHAGDRLAAARASGAIGLIEVDDPGFTLEPPRWPEPYARRVTIREGAPPEASSFAVFRLSPEGFAQMIAGTGRSAAAILADGSASKPLAAFDIPGRFRAALNLSRRDYASDNVLGLLPGTDPELAPEVVVVSAHLDGYGFGEPVRGDAIYHGTLDDVAYVATLVRLAEQRKGQGFKRSVLFAAFTGEEKGLLGSTWFVRHPTVPRANLAADINLDQLRPLFPLKILTAHGLDLSSLGDVVRRVAASMGIEVRPDLEPERNLLRRADHWPFLEAGVPATGFVFGYDPGTEAERRYREWYQIRYHRPQDDVTQPMDFQAAADFNAFFYKLTATVADQDARPAMRR
jgi:hypothetical protein